MTDVAARFRAFLADVPCWLELLAAVPAEHVRRHDTIHPAFHGCIDWHSACHAVWALLAYQRLTGDKKYSGIVDEILMPAKLADEAADLAARPSFEMPYGRAWLLRLALEDRLVTGSTRLTFMARDVAASIVEQYRAAPPQSFAREYANPCWALINLFDYASVENKNDISDQVRRFASQMAEGLGNLPSEAEEETWSDFMAVTPAFCDLLLRTGAASATTIMSRAGHRLLALKPVAEPEKAHHHALNFSRAWSLASLFEATKDERILGIILDHIETNLHHPSWWAGDYRAVSHWVPQFGIFAIQRMLRSQKIERL